MNAANWLPSPPDMPPGPESFLEFGFRVATSASWLAGAASWPAGTASWPASAGFWSARAASWPNVSASVGGCCSLPGACVSLGVSSRWRSDMMRPIAAPAPRAKMSLLRRLRIADAKWLRYSCGAHNAAPRRK
eukprot:scaffold72489_cov75-Phaeocystis_antarctica.AAC.2